MSGVVESFSARRVEAHVQIHRIRPREPAVGKPFGFVEVEQFEPSGKEKPVHFAEQRLALVAFDESHFAGHGPDALQQPATAFQGFQFIALEVQLQNVGALFQNPIEAHLVYGDPLNNLRFEFPAGFPGSLLE